MNLQEQISRTLREEISANDAYDTYESIKTIIDGKRNVGFVGLDNIAYRLLVSLKSLKKIKVRSPTELNYIIYREGSENEARELYDIAMKYGGSLSYTASEEDSRRIGQILGYKKDEIEDYINHNKKIRGITENIHRIHEVMGLVSEQKLTLPHVVTDNHTGIDCDSLHGFQLKRNNADMNGIVKTALDNFKNQGVWVSDVKVSVNGMNVNWKVTIDKSSDGEFWNGFTSRGAGCNDNIQTRWNSESVGNGVQSIITKITSPPKDGGKPICDSVKAIELVKKVEFTNLGGNSFIQGFYRYKCDGITQSTSPKQEHVITGTDFNDLRNKLTGETKNISIDSSSVDIDINNYTVRFNSGNDKIIVISFIYDNSGKLDERLKNIELKNPTLKVVKRGNVNNNTVEWVLSIIY